MRFSFVFFSFVYNEAAVMGYLIIDMDKNQMIEEDKD